MKENIEIIENLLMDLRKYREKTNNFDMMLIADVVDTAIKDIEYYKEEYFTIKS